jgi:hypothetical protein
MLHIMKSLKNQVIIGLLLTFTGCYDRGCQQHTIAEESEKQTKEMQQQTKSLERIAKVLERMDSLQRFPKPFEVGGFSFDTTYLIGTSK